jgi:hypothetical protein
VNILYCIEKDITFSPFNSTRRQGLLYLTFQGIDKIVFSKGNPNTKTFKMSNISNFILYLYHYVEIGQCGTHKP